eukprot:gene22198-21653_t
MLPAPHSARGGCPKEFEGGVDAKGMQGFSEEMITDLIEEADPDGKLGYIHIENFVNRIHGQMNQWDKELGGMSNLFGGSSPPPSPPARGNPGGNPAVSRAPPAEQAAGAAAAAGA